jgi:hypothetical protein
MRYKFIALLACLLILTCSIAEAQRMRRIKSRINARHSRHGIFQFTGGVGMASYFGDLKNNEFNLWGRPSIQLGVQYRVNNNLHLRSEVLWYRIAGADSLNSIDSGIYPRNLSFRADNVELNAVALWYFFNKFQRRNPPTLNPYVFVGVALTTNNPMAYYEGEWHELRPLQTEGVQYSNIVFALPAGFGLTYHIDRNWDVSAEWGYRITFNDYLDDVSTTHLGVDNVADPLRRALSDRRPEIGLTPVQEGHIRGNPNNNDWYLVTALKVTFTPGPSNQRRYRRPKYR